MSNPKRFLAISAGKLAGWLIQGFRLGSASNVPGKVALKLDPRILKTLSQQILQHRVAITGTNGKSTTAGLLAAFLEAASYRVVHNQLGANMLPGVTASLVQKTDWRGHLDADFGVLEIDEASMPAVSQAIQQSLTVVTNLFRDQLDRYGELDTTAKLIAQGIRQSNGYVILNADDPMVTAIGQDFPAERVIYYGVEQVDYPAAVPLDFPVGFPREVTDCPVCQAPLTYTQILYGHLGHYTCSACDFKRPQPHLAASHIRVETGQSLVTIRDDENILITLTLPLPGLFNAYNLLAAVTAARWCQVLPQQWAQGLTQYQGLFGRAEKKVIDGKAVVILLIKNPIGATEVLKVVTADPNARVLIIINDDYADGRDISWLWDAPFELLAQTPHPIIVSGHRAEDMAVRLRYAGLNEGQIQVQSDPTLARQVALIAASHEETVYILPTYTALLTLSMSLASR